MFNADKHSFLSLNFEFTASYGFFVGYPLQVKEVFASIAASVGLSVGLAVGQSSIADEISELIKRPKYDMGVSLDPEDLHVELQSAVDILVATPGRLMDHITTTKGFTLEHLCYLVIYKIILLP